MHLAQLNIGKSKYALDDPRIADFMDNLDRINQLAERMPGFVWRLQDDLGNATAIKTHSFGADVIVNLSVWKSVETLEKFVWQTVHKKFYDRKVEWFKKMDSHHFVMWPVEQAHRPTLLEAKKRLDRLNAHGNSDFAFDWAHLPHVKLWQEQACG